MKILIIENQALMRIGIKSALKPEGDMEIIGEAKTSAEGLEMLKGLRPDILLTSLRTPDSCAIEDIEKFLAVSPRLKIIVLADHAGDAEITKSIKLGALGYLLKDISPEELIKAIRIAASGKRYIPTGIAEILSENIGMEDLTRMEQSVLRMIVGGMSNMEIAFGLDISENTVKTHIKNIFDKMGVSDRTSATTMAIKRGLVRIDL